jgi:hypothetical protein
MNVVRTPTRELWQLHNGAVITRGLQIASAVVAMNPQGDPAVLVVSAEDHDKFVYIPLHQKKMTKIIFEVAAMLAGEIYLAENRDLDSVTGMSHIYYDTVAEVYYFSDETSMLWGPYWTRETAKDRLEDYCVHHLGDGEKYVVTFKIMEDPAAEKDSTAIIRAMNEAHARRLFAGRYAGDTLVSIVKQEGN